MHLFSLKSLPLLSIHLSESPSRRHALISAFGKPSAKIPVFLEGEDVEGEVRLELKGLKRYSHRGVRINLYGVRRFKSQKENDSSFIYISKELLPAGTLFEDLCLPFLFRHFDRPFESYYGHKL